MSESMSDSMSVSTITMDPMNPRNYTKENALDLTPHIIQAFLIVFKNNLSLIRNFSIFRELGKHIDNRFYSYQFFVNIDDCECLVLTVGKDKDEMLFLNEFKMGTDEHGNPCCTLPTQDLLDVVTLVTLFSNMKYISIVDHSNVIIGKLPNQCHYILALFYILENGNSWYDERGFVSVNAEDEYKYNSQLLEKPLRFFHPQQQTCLLQIIHILSNHYGETFIYRSINDLFQEMTLTELMGTRIRRYKHKITSCEDPMYDIIMLLEEAFMFEDDKEEAIKKKVFYYEYDDRRKYLSRTVMPQVFEDYMENNELTLEQIQLEIGAISQFLISQHENIVHDDVWAETNVNFSSIMNFIKDYRLTHLHEMELDESVTPNSPISDWVLNVRENIRDRRIGGIKNLRTKSAKNKKNKTKIKRSKKNKTRRK